MNKKQIDEIMKFSKAKWLREKIDFIPNKHPYKVIKEFREIVFAKQGLTEFEIDELYQIYKHRQQNIFN